jgi:hypothetical protein
MVALPQHRERFQPVQPVESDSIQDEIGAALNGEMTESNSVEFIARTREVLRQFPGLDFAEYLNREGLMQDFFQMVSPYVRTRLGQHVHSLLPDIDQHEYYEQLTSWQQFCLCLLYINDPETARHSIDTYVVCKCIMNQELLGEVSESRRRLLETAGVVHDIGKIQVPSVILDNPFDRTELRAMFVANLIDPDRPREVAIPYQIEGEQREKYAPLFAANVKGGKPVEPPEDQEKLAAELFEDLERLGAAVLQIPVRYLVSQSLETYMTGKYPETMQRFLGDRGPKPEVIEGLGEYEEDMRDIDHILGRFKEIDGWNTTFKDAIDMHTIGTVAALNQEGDYPEFGGEPNNELITVAGLHHVIREKTGRVYQAVMVPDSQTGKDIMWAVDPLRLADTSSALSVRRAYKGPFEIAVIKCKLRGLVRGGIISEDLAERFINRFFADVDGERTDAMTVIAESWTTPQATC